LKKSDFHYDLPAELIAQEPLAQRSASRLLVVDAVAQRFSDRRFTDLSEYLRAGDLLVFNDTRVLQARLYGRKETGGAAEILIERVLNTHEALAQIGVSKKPRDGSTIVLDDGTSVRVLRREGEFYVLCFEGSEPVEKLLARLGRIPLPPYIAREAAIADAERYQTIYARAPGAVAAPTAGLHFDRALLDSLRTNGVDFGYVTLHVGAGTFQPLRSERIEDHVMHREWLNVGAELVENIRRTRAAGGRVIAVGTTVVRALEAARRSGEVQPFSGETQIFIFPGYRITSVDALITNFHLPESTLLMLVSSFAGRELVLDAYRHAVEQRYRFFSYGDAMLILPRGNGKAGFDPSPIGRGAGVRVGKSMEPGGFVPSSGAFAPPSPDGRREDLHRFVRMTSS
jgi:S-adenosylmethionine:tRNA ribosyltransferase-isomerase